MDRPARRLILLFSLMAFILAPAASAVAAVDCLFHGDEQTLTVGDDSHHDGFPHHHADKPGHDDHQGPGDDPSCGPVGHSSTPAMTAVGSIDFPQARFARALASSPALQSIIISAETRPPIL